jgi:hypothetical protein
MIAGSIMSFWIRFSVYRATFSGSIDHGQLQDTQLLAGVVGYGRSPAQEKNKALATP